MYVALIGIIILIVMVWQLKMAVRNIEWRLNDIERRQERQYAASSQKPCAESSAAMDSIAQKESKPEDEVIKEEPIEEDIPPSLPSGYVHPLHEFQTGEPEAFKLSKTWSWIIGGEDFRSKGVSLEYAIATTWLVRMAIVAILCGVAFFLKYSIEHGLMSPSARVSVSACGGLGALLLGLRLTRREYRLIGMGLIGGGFATLYGSVFAAFQIYNLLAQGWAFALMLLISLSVGVVAVRLNSMLTAVLGIVGAYATPLMLDTGVKNLPGLYAYVLIVGVGVIFISRYRSWRLLPGLGMLFTYGLFFMGITGYDRADFTLSLSFVTAYFLLFSGVRMLAAYRREMISTPAFCGMIINLLCYMSGALWLINSVTVQRYGASVTLGLVVFYMLWFWCAARQKPADSKMLVMLCGFSAYSLTMTLYLLLDAGWVSAAWAVQALVLLWIGCRADFVAIRYMAYWVFGVSLARLLLIDLDLRVLRSFSDYGAGALERFSTLGVLSLSVSAAYLLLIKALREGTIKSLRSRDRDMCIFGGVLAYFMLLAYFSLEIDSLMHFYLPVFQSGGVSVLWGVFALTSLIFGILRNNKGLRYAGLALFLLTASKALLYDMADLSQVARVAAFIGIGLTMLGGAFVYIRFKEKTEDKKENV
jgi:uncharacterized membrane protein